MKTYISYIICICAACIGMLLCLHFSLYFCATGCALIAICVASIMVNRISRMQFSYRAIESENERLHQRLTDLHRQQLYLRQLTENIDTALVVCTPSGHIDWMNQAAREYFGQDAATVPEAVMTAVAERRDEVDGHALSSALISIDGRRSIIITLKDVSSLMSRREMEAWQQLIRVLTHEIMNSLTPIISISETLSNENEAFSVINRRCRSLMEFVEGYRRLTRIGRPERTEFSVADFFTHLHQLYPEVSFPDTASIDGRTLYADRTQMEQVMINLLTNARESGATRIEVSMPDATTISVSDNGRGIPPDVGGHIFLPFFTTKPQGSGIGLSLCRQVMIEHGGTIGVESKEGEGTVFTLCVSAR